MEESGQGNEQEVFKLYLDLFKHLGTLSVAVPLLVVALYRDIGLASLVTSASLLTFGGSLILFTVGAVYALLSAEDAIHGIHQSWTRSALVFLLIMGIVLFLLGAGITVTAVR